MTKTEMIKEFGVAFYKNRKYILTEQPRATGDGLEASAIRASGDPDLKISVLTWSRDCDVHQTKADACHTTQESIQLSAIRSSRGNVMADARKRLGLRQSDVAERVGITTNRYQLLESGQKPVNRMLVENFFRLAEVLEIDPYELLDNDNNNNS